MNLNPIAPNQTELSVGGNLILFSYKTPVAARVNGKVFRTSQKWSATTSKHINAWLRGENAEEKPQEFFDSLIKG